MHSRQGLSKQPQSRHWGPGLCAPLGCRQARCVPGSCWAWEPLALLPFTPCHCLCSGPLLAGLPSPLPSLHHRGLPETPETTAISKLATSHQTGCQAALSSRSHRQGSLADPACFGQPWPAFPCPSAFSSCVWPLCPHASEWYCAYTSDPSPLLCPQARCLNQESQPILPKWAAC